MMVYALLDTVVDDLWAIDGIAFTTLSRVNIAMCWLDLEHDEPGRYTIISAEISAEVSE